MQNKGKTLGFAAGTRNKSKQSPPTPEETSPQAKLAQAHPLNWHFSVGVDQQSPAPEPDLEPDAHLNR